MSPTGFWRSGWTVQPPYYENVWTVNNYTSLIEVNDQKRTCFTMRQETSYWDHNCFLYWAVNMFELDIFTWECMGIVLLLLLGTSSHSLQFLIILCWLHFSAMGVARLLSLNFLRLLSWSFDFSSGAVFCHWSCINNDLDCHEMWFTPLCQNVRMLTGHF